MIAGAVTYDCNSTFSTSISATRYDFSLQGATMGSFDPGFMCNGAKHTQNPFFTALNGLMEMIGLLAGTMCFYYKKPLNNFQTKYII
jgi:hypothetical protein